jgi:PAS domain S-box-containing protein
MLPHVLADTAGAAAFIWPALALVAATFAAIVLLHSFLERRRLKAQLAHSRREHEHLRMLISQLPAIIWTVDHNLRFSYIEGAGMADLGNTPDDMLGKTVQEYFNTDRSFRPVAAHEDAVRLAKADTYEVAWHNRTYHVLLEPLRDSAGKVAGAIGVALDITARKAAETALAQSQARYGALLKAIPDLLFRLRADGTVIEFIDNFAAPTAYTPGKHVKDMLPPEDAERLVQLLQVALKTGQTQSLDLHCGQYDQPRVYETRLIVVAEDEVLAISRNITDLRNKKNSGGV